MQFRNYEAIKVSKENQEKFIDAVVTEAPLQININNEPYTVLMRTPGDDKHLIRGLLFAEDIYKDSQPLKFTNVINSKNHFSTIDISIPNGKLGKGYMNKRTLLSVSSCGICGKKSLEDIKVEGEKLSNSSNIDILKVLKMFDKMQEKQKTFKETGASHAASIFDINYNMLSVKEDIGRHNAVDKAIGQLMDSDKLSLSKYLLVSGRVSYEIVTKAFIAKIPTIIAVSGCSSLAIDFSKEFQINLIGFSRNSKLTIYNK